MCMNPECANELYDMYFKGPWTTDHRHKQRQAFFDACARWPSQQAEVKTTKVTGKATVSGVTADVYSYADFLQSQGMKPAAALRKAKASIGGRGDHAWRYINSGGLEQTRQQALYVELSDKKIGTPHRVTRVKAFDVIMRCREAFFGIADLGYSGFNCESTSKSEWLASLARDEIELAFEMCSAHNKH